MRQKEVLDVGCGNKPLGDINVDLQKHPNVHGLIFIRADARNLPFRDKIFARSLSHHCIEHVDDPHQMIQEMKRVTRGKIEIRTPLLFSYDYRFMFKGRIHKHWFLPYWFRKAGFVTNIRVNMARPVVLGKRFPIPLVFYEIKASS